MKNKLKMCLSYTIILLTLWGCAASERSGSTEQTSSGEPLWWFNPSTSETYYYGFGQAKKQNPSLAQKVAKQRARQSISDDVKSNITSEIRDYMQESGLGENAQAIEFSENTTVSLSDNVLQGATGDKYYKANDGTVYIRVSYSKNAVSKGIISAAKREEALYNEFKAGQAFDRMEKQLGGGN